MGAPFLHKKSPHPQEGREAEAFVVPPSFVGSANLEMRAIGRPRLGYPELLKSGTGATP
jgi:hypothetical protein